MSTGKLLEEILKKYLSILQLRRFKIKGTTIVDREGLIISSILNEEIEKDEDAVGMITGILQGLSERIKNEFKTGLFKNAMIETDQYVFYFVEAGDQAILTTILDNTADLDLGGIRPYARIFTRKIDNTLSGKTTTPEIEAVEAPMPTTGRAIPSTPTTAVAEEVGPAHHFKCKAIIVGDFSVGKTSLLVQFAEKKFTVDYKPTIGVSVVKKEYYFAEQDTLVDLLLFDIAAQSRFLSVRHRYYEGADISMIVFDVTRPETLDSVHNWYYDVSKFLGGKLPSVVVANKCDLVDQRKIDRKQAEILAKTLELPYVETSAKTTENVDKAFKMLVQEYLKVRIIPGV
ncbi:MAG: GTP-binding protein [Candidatus Helarchaeota archaeon]|nr:GTP-binding protein [Candidatus Helarchaeota archaeon]